MSSEIIYQDATSLAELIRSGDLSPVEVVQAHLDRIDAVNPDINAIVTLADDVLEKARKAERAVREGGKLGAFHGVPFTVKDSIDTGGLLTQRGSPIFRGRTPSSDATVVTRMKAAGAIVLAKTNLPEFSYATETNNLLTGRTNNPWDLDRTPGGSSGGESAAIAAGMSPIGLGSDVAISLRGPAAHTGIVALKASHGRIPMTGLWPRVPRRFWHVGPMARSVRDIARAYHLLVGPDGADGFAVTTPETDLGIGDDRRPLRIGWATSPEFGLIDSEVSATVEAAADALRDAGAHVEHVDIPSLAELDTVELFWKLQVMEAKAAFHEVTDGHESEVYKYVRTVYDTPDTGMRDFVVAEQQAESLRDVFASYFHERDVLICPVTPVPAHGHDAAELSIDGQMTPNVHIMQATSPFNITGLPALSMRFGTSRDGLPIAVQIVAPWLAESTVLRVAAELERVSPVRGAHPDL
ncbi:glutamyl-tRNA(Gln) amidotransferase subunit A [Agreia sp. Leaf244]|uniref:amidase n=1 Tax=Agreia sp. Leaf244 TaxID=1736305 RepID=UPI000700929E|nr:amidase [Agreia sp. Leaf244]KQO05436.1 glutamyl-tRNA(Gln) amidotransferase subunit A [Agreia sp. Leaf244]